MNSKAYSAQDVNRIQLASFLQGREGQGLWVGFDVGKMQLRAVLNWGPADFERPWAIDSPTQIRLLVGLLKQLDQGRKLIVALEPSGTYGDVLRQACTDAGITVHRVSPKAAHDYAEVFDGVPSQHDGKDAAVIAELARLGKSSPWPWSEPSAVEQRIEYHVDRMDTHRRLVQMGCGRIESRLARHWPEVTRQLKLSSMTLLNCLAEHGSPAALASDPQAAAKLSRWSRRHLSQEKIAVIVDEAKHSIGVRPGNSDRLRLREYAAEALTAKRQVKAEQKRLAELSRDHRSIRALSGAVGNATACVLFTYLGDPRNYPAAAAYAKAMGLNLTERSSGKYQGKLKISKRGPSAVRYWMYLAAIRLVKQHSPVRPWYLKKKHRDSDQGGRALVAIMRRLAAALYHVAALGEAFEPKRLFPGKRCRRKRPGSRRRAAVITNRKGG